MEYREIEGQSLDEAKMRIIKEYGDRARIIKVVETYKGGFLGLGRKKSVKVLVSIPDVEFLKKYKENLGIRDIASKKSGGELISKNTDPVSGDTLSLLMEKLDKIENDIQKNKNGEEERLHPNLKEMKEILKENEFSDEFISEVIEKTKEVLSYSKLDNSVEVHKFGYDYIKERMITSDESIIDCDAKNVLVFVGPTGVGKTTTVAKIAANAVIDEMKVELITIDGFRLGAKEQLEKYAEIMHVKMSSVEENLKLQKTVGLSDSNLVLIDTIGRSAKDDMGLVKMKQLLKIDKVKTKFVLTVSASTKPKEIEKIFKNFEIFDYDYVVITKLDESETIGAILDASIQRKKRIIYYTDGQKVPNDIKKATPANLMEKINGLNVQVYLSNV